MGSISIIIISFNRVADSLELLQCIRQLGWKDELLKEVILLNNASQDDYGPVKNFAALHREAKIRYVEAPSNLGVSRGRNYAASIASGDIFLFMDDDIIIEQYNLLQALDLSFKRTSLRKLGVMSCLVRYTANRQIQVNAFPHKDFTQYRDLPNFLTSYYIGCAHAFLRECWEAAGNYPEDFFYGMEEYDESYRVINAGYAIGYDASIEVFHKESPLGRTTKSEKLRMMWVNKSIVAWRWLPFPYFITTAIAWTGFYLIRSGFSLPGLFKGIAAVAEIPFKQKRTGLKKSSAEYLSAVKARLWF